MFFAASKVMIDDFLVSASQGRSGAATVLSQSRPAETSNKEGEMSTYSFKLLLLAAVAALTVVASPLFAQAGTTTYLFGHLAIGGGAATEFAVHNSVASPINVSIELFESNGNPILVQQVTLAASETRTISFGGTAGTMVVGWARLSSAQEFLATCFYRIDQLGNVGVLPGELTTQFKLFAYHGKETMTGVAFANPSVTASSTVTGRIYNLAGQFQGQASLTLLPLGQRALYLYEPPFNLSSNGFVEFTATQPVVVLTLRQDSNLLSSAPVITSQATGISGYERVSVTIDFTNLAGSQSGHVTCPGGKKALGGSAYIDWLYAGDRPLVKMEDYPSSDTAWTAWVNNYNTHNVNGAFKVVVICANAP
jgi:hypothetical protein